MINSTTNSYSQVFFSDNMVFAIILIASTFIHPFSGISGLFSVIISNLFAWIMGLNRKNTESGYYGFNALLVGLGLGAFYDPSFVFFVLLFFTALLTLFFTITFSGIIGKYNLPFLSIPFLLAFWIAMLAAREFKALDISQKGIYMINEIFSIGSNRFVKVYEEFGDIKLLGSLTIYLKSLGAIFFEYNMLAGLFIAIGLLIYSRIAFCLSLIGFYTAFLFYHYIGGNITDLTYSYIGFNFILTSIALGGFFIIPSAYSYLWIVILTPLIVIVSSGVSAVLAIYQLPIYSLPFNIVVLVFLYVLKFRVKLKNRLQLVTFQQNSPEKNLYSYLNYAERYGKFALIPVSLPFISKWHVSQGQNGKITHKDEWKDAWDFDITDYKGKSYSDPGNKTEDYYCHNKPVTSPAAGTVIEIQDGIDDNRIGELDLEHNWGNTIVIKHGEFLYSKLSHLKKESFRVKMGDYIKKGDIVAMCGNSGRSPEPHIHFQLQATPYIGSKTIDYPIAHFIRHHKDGCEIKFNDRPVEADVISNIERNEMLVATFNFVPGKTFKFVVNSKKKMLPEIVEWEVFTDILNQSYLYEKETDSYAWFHTDGDIHYFNNYKGSKKSLLYYFFLAAYRVPLGFYKGLTLTDVYRADIINNRFILLLQDFIAPFYRFLKADYQMVCEKIDKDLSTNSITLSSSVNSMYFGKTLKQIRFNLFIEKNTLVKFAIEFDNQFITAECIEA